MKTIIVFSIAILSSLSVSAQLTVKENIPNDTAKHKRSLSLGSGGLVYDDGKPQKNHLVEVQVGMLDIGINTLQDKTNYSSPEAQSFLKVDGAHKNADLFSLRASKSINVNIYPVMLKMQLHKSETQRWQLATGLGLQIYNFRFTKPVSYTNDPVPAVVLDTVSFSKNKLATNYLTVPLMLNAKTRLARGSYDSTKKGWGSGTWLTYGIGVSGGYLLSSWTKQISDERSKDKNHDPFNLSKTNFCVNGEIGLDSFIRLYVSYQVTALHSSGLDQHPFSIGVRFLGL